ncbi:fucose 4-O-acetylase-like acetyltransferase [Motilibacter peucedani]|uniref:Fucose 4-O-acetylase-like acetyltransferase n=1 Tax=Motilibacter peucedani TaxID=598650 RepID=A0A420XTY9_9ACTN|nr:acyltransferase family protein [Motilibacter peucedani]RKS80298.1 fucose 4-O-acetylase-like acetyltransferase [Motilibacter peucedani]
MTAPLERSVAGAAEVPAGDPTAPAARAGSRRDVLLDALKGLAIVLVVVGHGLEDTTGDFDANPVFRVIYSFHMPLFMFLSGVAAAYSRDLVSAASIWRRARTLVVPFAAWYAVSYVVLHRWDDIGVAAYVKQLVRSPDFGLWFLWVLFLCYCALGVAVRLERLVGLASFVLVFVLVYEAPVTAYGAVLLRWHLFFFFAGYLLKRARVPWHLWWGVVPALAFLPLALTWRRNADPNFAARLSERLSTAHLSSLDHPVLKAYEYLVPCLGIAACFTVVAAVLRWRRALLIPLLWLAPFTLDVYAIHVYFFRWHIPGLAVVPVAAAAIAGSLAVSVLLLRRSKVLSTVLLGGR